MLEVEYDPEADAVYLRLGDAPYAFGRDIDERRRIDFDANGNPIGIEILFVSSGLNLEGLPLPANALHAALVGAVPAVA